MQSTPFNKLQLKLLGNSGELLNIINCYSGKVTVFRATRDHELQSYQRAISGRPGPERFSILLDQQPFQVDEHTLIGFGEQFANGNVTVYEYLHSCEIEETAIAPLALSCGLEQHLKEHCHNLTADLLRRLELIAATYSVGRILILNTPFEPIASGWREHFAQLISDYAQFKKQLVVVTKLVYRPECWIDNDTIIRVQVGENIKRTIGFGMDSTAANEMINSFREMFKDQASVEKLLTSMQDNQLDKELQKKNPVVSNEKSTETAIISSTGKDSPQEVANEGTPANQLDLILWKKPTTKLLWRNMAIVTVMISTVLVLYYLGLPKRQHPTKPQVAIGITTEAKRNTAAPEEKGKPVKAITVVEQRPILETNPPQKEPETSNNSSFIEQYPENIKIAIQESFAGTFDPDATSVHKQNDLPLINSENSDQKNEKKQLPKTNLFALLQAASNTGTEDSTKIDKSFPSPEGAPWIHRNPMIQQNAQDNDADAEAKRQIVHQRFLDAIKRASERRTQQENF